MEFDKFTEGIVCPISGLDKSTVASISTCHDHHFEIDGGAVVYLDIAIDLWKRMMGLPVGEQSRCHIPRYAIGLMTNGGVRCIAAICWECNNISINQDDVFSWKTFDGESAEAKKLLSDIKAICNKNG